MKRVSLLFLFVALSATNCLAEDGWISLFDGKTP